MSTTPIQDARSQAAPPAAAPEAAPAAPERRRPTREEALSRRIRRATLRRRVLQATDALAVADLLLGMNGSLNSLGEDPA
jgi:hypothetical protein